MTRLDSRKRLGFLGDTAQTDGFRSSAASLLLVVGLSFGTAGCAHMKPFAFEEATQPRPASLPDGGTRLEPPLAQFLFAQDEDYVVRIVAGEVTCSGTLIAEDRVLTAHHCVSARAADGSTLIRDVSPEVLRVELGGDYLPWGEVGVRAVIAPPCGHVAGNGDIAVLVLERRLRGVTVLAPELDRAPELGIEVSPIGFGRCALSRDGIKRHQRDGGPITEVETDRFELTASICPGDSGGPGVDDRGRLIGLVSASAMDGSDKTQEPSEFTRLDRWRSVFSHAQLIAGGVPASELPPLDCEQS
jgi:hypothetical protein